MVVSEIIEPTIFKKEEVITIEEVRAVLAEKSQSGKQKQVKALIQKYGANKLTDVEPSCYKELLKEAEVL
jgi:DNA replication protein DnaD